jgi:RNA polymerase sigma-70 factor (ECF subfamily)
MGFMRTTMDHTSDEELMALLTRGEQAAFDALYERYSKPLFHFFYRLLNSDRNKAEDFLHDLFLKIIEKKSCYDASKPFKTWVFALAGNMVKNEYRRQNVRQAYTQFQRESPEEGSTEQQHTLDKQLFHQKLEHELEKMHPDERLLIQLRFMDSFSIKQLAETLDIPEGTVKSRLHTLTKLLSEKLSLYSYH